jgi:hypothetical protein
MATPESGVGAGRFVFTFFLSAATVLGLSTCVMDWTSPPAVCGDGVVDEGEDCDGTNLDGETCTSLGYYGGTLSCNDCTYDLASCRAAGRCGDSTINGPENCEGTDLGGETCESLDYYGGTLACGADCTFDFTSCVPLGVCGDDRINHDDEECDGTDLGGQTCVSLGRNGGQLNCWPVGDVEQCKFDTTACF